MDGTFDNSFGMNGIFSFPQAQDDLVIEIYGLEIDDSGKIIFSGVIEINSELNMLVCRLNSNGTLDASFNNSGYKF